MQNGKWRGWRLMFAIAAVAIGSVASAAPVALLGSAEPGGPPEWLKSQLGAEIRGRIRRLDPRMLHELARPSSVRQAQQSFALDLFEDVALTVDVQKVEDYDTAGSFVVHGRAAGDGTEPGATVLLSVVNDTVQGEVLMPDGRKFALQSTGPGLSRISEMNASDWECVAGKSTLTAATLALRLASAQSVKEPLDAAGTHDGVTRAAEGEGAIVDVMIVYTPEFEKSLGSADAVRARAQLAISTANTAFEKSQIKARVRLAHTGKVNYVSDADMAVDLWRLADPSDGYLDEVAGLREQYSADVVHLFGSVGNARRGQATGYPSEYNAVVIGGDTSTFVHELGHNFGCQHDRDAAGIIGSVYAFGHIFAGSDGRKYGCIMSYTGAAGAMRITQFSNPDVSFAGNPTGVPKGHSGAADNARMLDLTAPVIAAAREPDGSSSRMPIYATPARIGFPITPAGTTTAPQRLRLASHIAGRSRPLRVSDFQVTGQTEAFLVQIYDPAAGQFITGPNFTVPESAVELFVRFRPTTSEKAEAAITFKVDDPSHTYRPPPIRLVGNATAPLLKNIATRGLVGTGDDALIGGFIVGGSTSREVVVRAIWPGNLPGALIDPELELYRGSELIARNDDWGDGFPRESIRWSSIAPREELDSAILARLEPGSYTAVVRGHRGTTGVGLIEAYDLDSDGEARFLNIATRGAVAPGDAALIGGFILGGDRASKVVVRAIGPSLGGSGVRDALPDPTVDLHNSQGARLVSNDDWRSDDEDAISGTGLALTDDRESAILQVLAPGSYTAVVRGAGETSGTALVEVYQLHGE